MANEIISGTLSAALTQEVVNGAFDIARSNRTGLLSVVSMGNATQAFDGYKMSWLDMRVDATSANASGNFTDSATTINVATGEGAKFRVGMTFGADGSDEEILVTAINADALTVVRGFGATVAEAGTTGVQLTINSTSRPENSLAENDGIFQPEKVENFFQTMDTAVEMSRRALSTMQWGDTNDLQFQISERIRQLTIQLDRALIRGRKDTATIAGEEYTYTGGMRFYTSQAGAINVDHSAGALTLDAIQDLNAEIVKRGGMSDTIVVGINKARELNKLVAANYSSQRLADWSNDEGSVTMLPSDIPLLGTTTTIVVDTNVSDDELFILEKRMVTITPMNANNANSSGAWQTKDATQPGQDGERVRILGDFAFEIRQSKTHMARLYNIG